MFMELNNQNILQIVSEEYLRTGQINPVWKEELPEYNQGFLEVGEQFLGCPIDFKDKTKSSFFSQKDRVYLFGKKGGEFSHVFKIYKNQKDAFGEKIAYDLLSGHLPPFARLAQLIQIGKMGGELFWIMERVKGISSTDAYGKANTKERVVWTEKLALVAASIHRENVLPLAIQEAESIFQNKLLFLKERMAALEESKLLKKIMVEEMPRLEQLAKECLKEPMTSSLAFGDFHESNYLFSLESGEIHLFDQSLLLNDSTIRKSFPINRENNVAVVLNMLDSLALKKRIRLKEVSKLKEVFFNVWRKETNQGGSFNMILFCYRHRILSKLLQQISKAPSNLDLIADLYFDYLSNPSFLD